MLIKTKFQIPYLGNSMVKRKRLHNRLDQIGNCRVIMVTAPAGYGKTAFISSWASGKKEQTVTWLTLDEEDNEEELFWSYFLLSFYGNEWVPEEMKQRADAMLRQAVSFSRLHLTYFINDLTEIGKETTMVLDDFGAIRSQKVINDLAYLIRYLPSHIHLILSGREQMDIGLAKYKAAGEVLELTREELAIINGQKGVLCEAQLLLAVIYEKAGQSRLALHMLEAAVSLAEGQGCFQPFLNEGKIVEKMLKRLTGSIFTEGLLSCFKTQPSVTEGAEGLNLLRQT